jgi:hypothetical protein
MTGTVTIAEPGKVGVPASAVCPGFDTVSASEEGE